MFALTRFGRFIQRTVCMLLATVIVTGSLSLGVAVAESAQCLDYSVTITQLS
jgi:hypothetical protein